MTSENTEIALPIITVRSRGLSLRIDTGELLVPAIVLVFCAAYFYETRGLPAESMLYANPLLYATAFLAVITVFGHVVSIRTDGDNQPRTATSQSVVWGVEKSVAEQEHPHTESTHKGKDADTEQPIQKGDFFNIRAASYLVVLSGIYILSLYVVPFVLSTAAFLAVAVYLFGERSIRRIILYAIGFTLVLWLVFINWLMIPLP